MWKQVVRCLDWRRKWDLIWTAEDNLNKLQKGGSRWHSGQHWNPPSQMDFNRMSQNYPNDTPGSDEFYAKHQASICDGNLPNHKHMATVYTCGNLCDKLEEDFADLVLNLPQWQETEAKGVRANARYDKELKQLLEICGETLESMVTNLKANANALGEEMARHAAWLDQAKAGVAMTKEQVDEIKHAIVKGRPHLARKLKSETPPIAVAATGPSGASSSGLRYPNVPSRTPSRNPPMHGSASYQGAVKRAFSDRGSADPFAPTVQKHRQEQAKAAPTVRRNPNVDVRYGDGFARATPSIPPSVVPIIGTPPGDWTPGKERNAAARAQAVAAKARAAAAALLYADDRRRNPPIAAVARVRPTISQDPPRADSVAYIATRQRSFPPRREPSRGARSELIFHPENPRFVWSHLEQTWVAHDGSTETTYRGTRSRSPPPRPGRDPRDPRDDPYRVTW